MIMSEDVGDVSKWTKFLEVDNEDYSLTAWFRPVEGKPNLAIGRSDCLMKCVSLESFNWIYDNIEDYMKDGLSEYIKEFKVFDNEDKNDTKWFLNMNFGGSMNTEMLQHSIR